ncbi:hypothetical protein A2966_04300 [Candidatus Roizmanbacteria bacterium RIFCSPLOWO2_01_FULL_41_22]|uniref:Response regulatory domain-containing protein n=1 Tax=Candidatus Roizmanbacteria bacterium RIFCSPLOWO2_01_FULL_41_22 TaxID=1802067 RepID=A0A1F7J8Q5_9BACT|nr:MAG: hypothetical protein A2966_04300 [Candidatus Roizmanbacteria bacterium RIFCSPLOWO2_01_FULL_41_22]
MADPSIRILIVEDEMYIRELYQRLLLAEGYQVDTAADGEAGLMAIKKGGYDLVLLDIILPKLDGLKILEYIAGDQQAIKANKGIVILSNLGQETIVSHGKFLGVKGHLVKTDLTPQEFINEVKKYL